MSLSRLSIQRLRGVDARLAACVIATADVCDVMVGYMGGRRTPEQQATLVAQGASMRLNSRHLEGKAVDLVALVDGEPAWRPRLLYERIRDAMFATAAVRGVGLVWGGYWPHLQDLGHFELDERRHPVINRPVPRPKRVELL